MYLQMATMAGKISAVGGKKLLEISIPAVKKASLIGIRFIQGGISAVNADTSAKENIKLNKKLGIVDNGLSIPLSFSENQIKRFAKEISNEHNIIKGQNEILFLSNSIDYFVSSHTGRTGIDRGISHALQYDLYAVRGHVNKCKDLRFPGYLLHQCNSLAETVKELNIFYCSVLQNGLVPQFTKEEVDEQLTKCYGARKRKG